MLDEKQLHKESKSLERAVSKILVVEDSRVNQQLIKNILSRLGCHHEVVANGKLGVEKVVYGDFDLVLIDCNMPMLGGYEAT